MEGIALIRHASMRNFIALSLAASLSFASPLLAVDVVTDPVGFVKITALTNSDTFVSIPMTRLPIFAGGISSAVGNQITVTPSPGWTPNQFVYPSGTESNTFYVFIASGAKEGASFTITNNTVDTLLVDLDIDSLSGVVGGDKIQIIPYWTLGTLFPDGAGAVASTNTTLGARRTEVLFPDFEGTGINLSSSTKFFYLDTDGSGPLVGNWRKVGGGTTNQNPQVVLSDAYFVIRQNVPSSTTTLVMPGGVPMKKLRVPLYASNTSKQDTHAGLQRPASVTLDQSGLTNDGAFASSLSTSLSGRRDELLVFDNNAQQLNKSAAQVYFYSGGIWRKAGDAAVNAGSSNVFLAGRGVLVRKFTNATPDTLIWINTPNY